MSSGKPARAINVLFMVSPFESEELDEFYQT